MAALVDTNVLVYRYDSRFPRKQRTAADLLRWGSDLGSLILPHQAIVEFVAVTTRPLPLGQRPLLTVAEALREAGELPVQFEVLYPNEEIVRLALKGTAAYQMSWFDAHLWAYAEFHGLPEIVSEDFDHGQVYGSVRIVNPFVPADFVHEAPAPYGP